MPLVGRDSRTRTALRRRSHRARVIADTKTGLSGAGRALGLNVHFSEADENVAPYGLDGHRHLPGDDARAGALAEAPATGDYVRPALHPDDAGHPQHLLCAPGPAALRGCRRPRGVRRARRLRRVLRTVAVRALSARRRLPRSTSPAQTTAVVHPSVDLGTGHIVVASAIDNLGKGAAGAAVQCLNVMLGLPETTGLQQTALFP